MEKIDVLKRLKENKTICESSGMFAETNIYKELMRMVYVNGVDNSIESINKAIHKLRTDGDTGALWCAEILTVAKKILEE